MHSVIQIDEHHFTVAIREDVEKTVKSISQTMTKIGKNVKGIQFGM